MTILGNHEPIWFLLSLLSSPRTPQQLSLTSLKSLYESLRFIASNGIPAHTNRQGNMHTQQQKDTHYSHFSKEKRRGRAGVRGVEGRGGAFKNIQHRSKASPVLCELSSRYPTQPQEEAEGGSAPRAEGSTGQQERGRDTPCLKGICFILNWCLGPRLRFASAAMTAMEMCFL